MKFSIRKKVNLGFFLSLSIIICLILYTVFLFQQGENNRNLSSETYSIIVDLKNLNFKIKELEILKLEFLISNEAEVQEKYYRKIYEIQIALKSLNNRPLFQRDNDKMDDLRMLESILESKLNCNQDCLELKKKFGIRALLEKMMSDEEKELIDSMNFLINSIEQKEYLNLIKIQNAEQNTQQKMIIFIITGGLFSVIMFLILIIFINKDIKLKNIKEEELAHLSITDELTGLYNRRGFIKLGKKKFSEASKDKHPLYLFFIDMDGLKKINDTLGHEIGDKAIVALSNLLKQSFRLTDLIARMGGDEFAVIMVDEHVTPETIQNRLMKKLNDYNETKRKNFDLSFSIGVEKFDPENPISIEEMLKIADERMYRHKKKEKKNRV
ncbi:MAG: diguanylate cyclase [Leptospiraceae bacterium]|nr:diguanylate cyclase [Leptospiraceae bacterium]MCP5511686.1 diguanylate cyclase [Leptospiraceae bacterium]